MPRGQFGEAGPHELGVAGGGLLGLELGHLPASRNRGQHAAIDGDLLPGRGLQVAGLGRVLGVEHRREGSRRLGRRDGSLAIAPEVGEQAQTLRELGDSPVLPRPSTPEEVYDELGRYPLEAKQAPVVEQVARMLVEEVVIGGLALLIEFDTVHLQGVERISVRRGHLLGLVLPQVERDRLQVGVVFEEQKSLAVNRADPPQEPELVGHAHRLGPLRELGLHQPVELAILGQALQLRPVADHEIGQGIGHARGPGVIADLVPAAVP